MKEEEVVEQWGCFWNKFEKKYIVELEWYERYSQRGDISIRKVIIRNVFADKFEMIREKNVYKKFIYIKKIIY